MGWARDAGLGALVVMRVGGPQGLLSPPPPHQRPCNTVHTRVTPLSAPTRRHTFVRAGSV